ncbi:CRAL TRIO domain-containing protein [Flagelloscypha sp. PMI_526]|nr:CRAL TRIO domain-containing protein [Flagelloscypha sp. PMI_526]
MSESTTAEPAVPGATPTPTTTAQETTSDVKSDTGAPPPQPGAIPTPPTEPKPSTTAAASAPTPTTKNEKEPQNDLTKKFTDAEWKALKAFRSQLPEIFSEAYTDEPKLKNEPTKIWGISVDPSNPTADARVSVILMKFLRARSLNVAEARKMLTATLTWRDVTFKVQDALKEEFPEDVYGKMAHIVGKDKEGQPVVYNLYGVNQDANAVFGDVERFLRWRVGVQERTVMQLDFETVDQTVQIHDYANAPSRTPESKKAATLASSIFGDHYPELLSKKLFVSVPTIMTWIFWAFKPILPSATFAKMSVVGPGTGTIKKALLPIIDEEEIPTHYGGKLDAGF